MSVIKKWAFNSFLRTIALILPFLLSINPCLAGEKLPVSTGEWKPYTSAEMEGHGFFSKIVTALYDLLDNSLIASCSSCERETFIIE